MIMEILFVVYMLIGVAFICTPYNHPLVYLPKNTLGIIYGIFYGAWILTVWPYYFWRSKRG